MKIATVTIDEIQFGVVIDPELKVVKVADLFPGQTYNDALAVLSRHTSKELQQRLDLEPNVVRFPLSSVKFCAPYRKPRMVLGIGLNYRDHAGDLKAPLPTDEPASFLKADHTIIGPEEPIMIPWQSERTTAEAEMGIVVGRSCRNVPQSEALDYLWGVVPVLDQTAEDILEKNPRFLTRSKNFPSFFSFGPWIVSMDELSYYHSDISSVEVTTKRNGAVHRSNTVSNMTFSPSMLLSFHSYVMPLEPGDIISTGTPGAVRLTNGDVIEAVVSNVGTLRNPVIKQEKPS